MSSHQDHQRQGHHYDRRQQQRSSRWNNSNNNNVNNHESSFSSSSSKKEVVTDDEAMRALLSSAEARERERDQDFNNKNKKRNNDDNDRSRGGGGGDRSGRYNDSSGDNRSNYNKNKRPRWGGSNNNPATNNKTDSRSGQRLQENNSYYGPEGGEGGNNNYNNNNNKNKVVENDDGVDSKQKQGKTTGGDDVNEAETGTKPKPEQKPNFGLSGALSKDSGHATTVYKGVQLKFQEPPEARAPNTQWRFYVFKGKDLLETLHISKQSAYLMGRNQDICDIHMLHPSMSSQHAVLQYRALPDNGRVQCRPYIMDLESSNGTKLNGIPIDPARYYQLRKGDVLTFGASTREYVLMTENTTSVKDT